MFRMKMTNRVMSGIVSATVFFSAATFSVTAKENITVTLNGQILSFDVPPQIINDRTMVPLRAIFEALGASVDWDEGTKTVTSSKDGTTITLTIDSNTMYVNGNAVALDSPACIIDGRTLVPVRAISEAYNTNVDWNGDTRTVTITSESSSSDTPAAGSNTPVATNYERLRQHVINYGTSLSTGGYGISYDITDAIQLYVITADDYVGMGLIMDGDTSDEAETYICLYESGETVISVTLNSIIGELTYMYTCDNGKFVGLENNTESAFRENAYDLLTAQVDLINVFLPRCGYGLTLEDFGIPVSADSSQKAAEQMAVYDRAAVSTPEQLALFDKLRDYIVKNGTYISQSGSYCILDRIDSEMDLFISVESDGSIGFVYTVELDGGNIFSQGTLIFKANEPISAIVRTKRSGVENIMQGYFLTQDKAFHYQYENTKADEAEQADGILRWTCVMFNVMMDELGLDINCSDFGIEFTS